MKLEEAREKMERIAVIVKGGKKKQHQQRDKRARASGMPKKQERKKTETISQGESRMFPTMQTVAV